VCWGVDEPAADEVVHACCFTGAGPATGAMETFGGAEAVARPLAIAVALGAAVAGGETMFEAAAVAGGAGATAGLGCGVGPDGVPATRDRSSDSHDRPCVQSGRNWLRCT
jgi:hypothetical protein